MDKLAHAVVAVTCAQPPEHFDWIGAAGAAAGIIGTLVAMIAIGVSVFQVRRDRQRERHQAVARALTAKRLIGAAYATCSSGVMNLRGLALGSPMDVTPAMRDQAIRLQDDQQLAIIFQALLTIDTTALTEDALKPVGDAQVALIALRNVIAGLAAGRSNPSAPDRLKTLLADIMSAFERMRGEVPFKLDQ